MNLLSNIELAIIICTETWLRIGIAKKGVLQNDYQFLEWSDRPSDSDKGDCVIVKSDITGVHVDTFTHTNCTTAPITCSRSKDPLTMGCLYRPSQSKVDYMKNYALVSKNQEIRYQG